MPTSPVPSRPKVPGSGAVRVEVPTRMCPIPLVHCWLVLKKVCVVVPVTLRPSYSVPATLPVRVQTRFSLPGGLTRVNVTGPTKLPVKSVTGVLIPVNDFAQAPTPVTINDPPPLNVPPVEIEPV